MTQIEQIKAELKKRLLKYDPDMTNAGQELQEVLAFIDSSLAESASPELDAEIDNYMNREFGEPWDGCRPVSSFDLRGMAWYFAEWQKRQDESNREEIYRAGVQDGMRYFKEQMMKEAVEGSVNTHDGVRIHSDWLPKDYLGLKAGDKVKIVILKKEDNFVYVGIH